MGCTCFYILAKTTLKLENLNFKSFVPVSTYDYEVLHVHASSSDHNSSQTGLTVKVMFVLSGTQELHKIKELYCFSSVNAIHLHGYVKWMNHNFKAPELSGFYTW